MNYIVFVKEVILYIVCILLYVFIMYFVFDIIVIF